MNTDSLDDITRASRRVVRLVRAAAIFAVLIGVVYTVAQTLGLGSVRDPFFIGLLSANSVLIWRLTAYFADQIPARYSQVLGAVPVRAREATIRHAQKIFHLPGSIASGAVFGLFFYSAPYAIEGIWAESPGMRASLAIFLAASNVVTGMAFHILVRFVLLCIRLGPHASVNLWALNCPIAEFIVTQGRHCAIAVAAVSLLAVGATALSDFRQASMPTLGFSLWALLVAAATYSLPMLPLTRRLGELKDKEVLRLSLLQATEFQRLHDQLARREEEPNATATYRAASSLLADVKNIRIFPPIGAKPIESAAWVSLLTFLPTIVEWLAGKIV